MGVHVNFCARPASSPSLSLPNRKIRNPSGPAPFTAAKAWSPNGELVGLFQRGRSFTTKSPIRGLRNSQLQQPSHLLIKHHYSGASHGVFSHNLNRNRYNLTRAAQKLAKSGHKSFKKQDGRQVEECLPYHDYQFPNESKKDSAGCMKLSSRDAHCKGRFCSTIRACTGDDGGGGQSMDSVPERGPQAGGGWLPYAIGSVSLASAVWAVKGIESCSAHASVGYGGRNGQQPPFGSGGGSGGGDSGGFDAGSSGESFFGDLIYGPGKKWDEESPRAVTFRRKIPDRLPAGALASLSSAAGDLMDGEAPIGGGGRIGRGLDESHHMPKQGSYSADKVPFDGMTESPRESMARSYNQPDPFFTSGDGRTQDRYSFSPSFERSANDFEESRGRDAAFPMMGRSVGYNPTNTHFSSGNQPQQYHNSYGQGNEQFSTAPHRGADGYYSSHATTSRDSQQFPQEFSSIRGRITEIPGYAPAGDEGKKSKDRHQGIDFSGWLGGIVNAIVGKRIGGGEPEAGGLSSEDVGKAEFVTEVTNRTLQMIQDPTTEHGLAKSSETGALRRLQRETFSDLLKIRERLEKLEDHTGARGGKNSGDAVAGGLKTTLKGEVNAGGAYVVLDDLTTSLSRYSLQHAGLLTGLDVRFTFETPVRENDLLTTQCGVGGQASGELDSGILGGPINLQKINYVAQINDALSVAVAPLGAKASDMAETVNQLQGQALTTFAGNGPTMYQHCRGSAIGASLRSDSVMLSMSQFLSGWGDRSLDTLISEPLCLSTLAQIMIQPCDHMVFSMSAVNNLWPCPPLPSSSGFHWSEMGPMVLCKTITRPTQPTGTFTFNDLLPSSSSASFLSQVHIPERDHWSPDAESRGLLGSSGTSMQSVAFSGEVDLGSRVSIGGWAQVERADWLEELERKEFQWNLSLAKASGPNVHWGLSMGRRKRDDWGDDGSISTKSGSVDPSQLHLEAFMKWKVGRGLSLQPGLVYILDKDTQTPAFMLRSSWTL